MAQDSENTKNKGGLRISWDWIIEILSGLFFIKIRSSCNDWLNWYRAWQSSNLVRLECQNHPCFLLKITSIFKHKFGNHFGKSIFILKIFIIFNIKWKLEIWKLSYCRKNTRLQRCWFKQNSLIFKVALFYFVKMIHMKKLIVLHGLQYFLKTKIYLIWVFIHGLFSHWSIWVFAILFT